MPTPGEVEQKELHSHPAQAGLALSRVPVFVFPARMKQDGVNLYLVGFTGTGKSTVGRQVARHLAMQFFDSDVEIERTQARTIAQIFADEGEPAFRGYERAFIATGHPAEGCVVACGGGLVVAEGMREQLQQRGVVICLHASLETVIERTARSTHRPLLDGADREKRVRELYAPREEIYRRTGTMILTDRRPLREVVANVLRVYEREAREWLTRQP